jgi:hypothetical protein
MAFEIQAKLRQHLSGSPVTEPIVVYVLVESRKYIEAQEKAFQDRYDLLKMYCDWALHASLYSSTHLIPFLEAFDAEAEKPEGSPLDPSFLKYSTLSEFRTEFGRFLRELDLPDMTSDPPHWKHTSCELTQKLLPSAPFTRRASRLRSRTSRRSVSRRTPTRPSLRAVCSRCIGTL